MCTGEIPSVTSSASHYYFLSVNERKKKKESKRIRSIPVAAYTFYDVSFLRRAQLRRRLWARIFFFFFLFAFPLLFDAFYVTCSCAAADLETYSHEPTNTFTKRFFFFFPTEHAAAARNRGPPPTRRARPTTRRRLLFATDRLTLRAAAATVTWTSKGETYFCFHSSNDRQAGPPPATAPRRTEDDVEKIIIIITRFFFLFFVFTARTFSLRVFVCVPNSCSGRNVLFGFFASLLFVVFTVSKKQKKKTVFLSHARNFYTRSRRNEKNGRAAQTQKRYDVSVTALIYFL